jgi:hypothetical protein
MTFETARQDLMQPMLVTIEGAASGGLKQQLWLPALGALVCRDLNANSTEVIALAELLRMNREPEAI